MSLCQFLNLRNSSFANLEAQYLLSLLYIDIAKSMIKNIDLLPCCLLQKVVRDQSQNVMVHDSVIIEVLKNIINEVSMGLIILPVQATSVMHDTQDQYKMETVSFGWDDIITLEDGTEIAFDNNLIKSATRIDERNLI